MLLRIWTLLLLFTLLPQYSAMVLNGWHRGELVVHQKLGHSNDYAISSLYAHISGDLDPDHAVFHSSLPFVPVTTLDREGRPWGSILARKDGSRRFISNPRYTTLVIDAMLWEGEPLIDNIKAHGLTKDGGKEMLIAGIGLEFSNRRRNKFAGKVSKLENSSNNVRLELTINQSIGNCPKYITIRDLVPYPDSVPKIAFQKSHFASVDRLPEEIISFILEADTAFFGTTYEATPLESKLYPSHVGMNHRGGRPGFIRVRSDGRTLVLPDLSGNRFMTSLGNVEASHLASITLISFTTGDILYLTGRANNIFGTPAQKIMPFQDRITTIDVTGYTFVRNALPVRQRPGTDVIASPYSPPIRYLAEEESKPRLFSEIERPSALLTSIDIHSPTIATFNWESSADLEIKPGQAIIMDFSPLVGVKRYQHMSPTRPNDVNDDRIRTWTVSSHHSSKRTRQFSLTMREKRGGLITGTLFTIARKLAQLKPEILVDSRPLDLSVTIVGTSGEFILPPSDSTISDAALGLSQSTLQLTNTHKATKRLLWIAGGIGITPFLSMLKSISQTNGFWDIEILFSTREPDVLLPMISDSLTGESGNLRISLHVFSRQTIPDLGGSVELHRHVGRLDDEFFKSQPSPLLDREVYVCGPVSFEQYVVNALTREGIADGAIKREGFDY